MPLSRATSMLGWHGGIMTGKQNYKLTDSQNDRIAC